MVFYNDQLGTSLFFRCFRNPFQSTRGQGRGIGTGLESKRVGSHVVPQSSWRCFLAACA